MINSPSDRVSEKASRWDHGRTETCGGEKVISGGSVLVSQYLRIYRSGIRSDGATWGTQGIRARLPPQGAPCCLVAHSFAVWSPPEASKVSFVQNKIVKKIRSVWTLFGTDFLENQK